MATNKRKEAAALFELIDKSTLKVPKHAGALKIPDWWSSKTNPPSAPSTQGPAAGAPAAQKMPAGDPRPVGRAVEPVNHVVASPEPATPQTRLFEPPAVADQSNHSPTIRPPSTSVSPPIPVRSPSSVAPLPTVVPVQQTVEPAPDEDPEAAPQVRTRERISTPLSSSSAGRSFASQTTDPGNSAAKQRWVGAQHRRVARTPMWVFVIGAALILLVLVLLVMVIARSRHKATPVETSGGAAVQAPTGTAGTLLLPPAKTSHPLTAGTPSRGLLEQKPLVPAARPEEKEPRASSGQGVVYGPGEVSRSPDLYYIMIASTPSRSIAERNAKFIADHGVSVSVEITNDSKGVMYRLLSAEGYPTLVAAEPHIKQIVRIGHETSDYKKSRRAWDDAFARKFKAVTK